MDIHFQQYILGDKSTAFNSSSSSCATRLTSEYPDPPLELSTNCITKDAQKHGTVVVRVLTKDAADVFTIKDLLKAAREAVYMQSCCKTRMPMGTDIAQGRKTVPVANPYENLLRLLCHSLDDH